MSHYTVEELIIRWRKEELTVEQMIGQILQVLKEQERRLKERESSRGTGSAETAEGNAPLRRER